MEPCLRDKRLSLLVATLGLRHIWLLLSLRTPGNMENYPESVQGVWFPAILGLGAGTMVTALLIFRALGYSAQLSGEGLLKSKGQSSTSVFLGNVKKSVPFFPQADQVFFDLSSIQVAWRTAAAAHVAALLLIVALQSSSGTAAAATGHTQVYNLQHNLFFFRLRYLLSRLRIWLVPCVSRCLLHSSAHHVCFCEGPVCSSVEVCPHNVQSCPEW